MSYSQKLVPVSVIKNRSGGDTRQINPTHLVTLIESIACIGLLEPVVVDQNMRLLAGGHRRVACSLVAESNDAKRRTMFMKLAEGRSIPGLDDLAQRVQRLNRGGWIERHPKGLIPVRIIDIDAAKDARGALLVEVSENERRKSYTHAEILALVKRLKAVGFVDRNGRPRKGEKALRPMLASIVGRSGRHLRQLLNGVKAKKAARRPVKVKGKKKTSMKPLTWDRAVQALRRSMAACRAAGERQRSVEVVRLLVALDRVERQVPDKVA